MAEEVSAKRKRCFELMRHPANRVYFHSLVDSLHDGGIYGWIDMQETFTKEEIKEALGARPIKDIDTEVDEVMDYIRLTHYLTTEVSRKESIDFLQQLAERCVTLAGEITHELLKHGEEH